MLFEAVAPEPSDGGLHKDATIRIQAVFQGPLSNNRDSVTISATSERTGWDSHKTCPA